jgi:hypothetical protein
MHRLQESAGKTNVVSLSLSLSLLVRFVEIARKRGRHWPRRRPTSSLHSSVGLKPSLSACVVRRWLHFTVGTRAYGFVTEKDRGKRKIVVVSLHHSSKTRSLRIGNRDFDRDARLIIEYLWRGGEKE